MAKQFETFNLDDEEEKTPEFKVNQPSDLNIDQQPMMEKPEDTYDYQKEGDRALAEASALEDNQPDDIDSLITALQPKPEEKLKIDHRYANDVSREPNELEKLLKGEGPIVRQSGGAPYSSQQVKAEEIKEVGQPAGMSEQQPALPSPSVLTQQVDDGNEYEKALRRRDLAILANQLGKASAQIGSSIAQVKPGDLSAFDTNIALARDIPKDVLEKFKYDEQDPNSKQSRDLRATIETITKTKIPENMSVSKIKELKIFDGIIKLQQAKSLSEYRQGQLGLSTKKIESTERNVDKKIQSGEKIAGMKAEQQKETRKDKIVDRDLKTLEKFSKEFNPALASSRSPMGKAETRVQTADNILAFINKPGRDKSELTDIEIKELARALDTMLANGMSTVSGTKMLIPKTALGDLAKIEAYIRGIPVGAKQAEFVKRYEDSVIRERKVSSDYINNTINSGKKKLKSIEEKNPELVNDYLSSIYRLDDKPTTLPTKKDEKIDKYAKDNNLTYEQALTIIENRKKNK